MLQKVTYGKVSIIIDAHATSLTYLLTYSLGPAVSLRAVYELFKLQITTVIL